MPNINGNIINAATSSTSEFALLFKMNEKFLNILDVFNTDTTDLNFSNLITCSLDYINDFHGLIPYNLIVSKLYLEGNTYIPEIINNSICTCLQYIEYELYLMESGTEEAKPTQETYSKKDLISVQNFLTKIAIHISLVASQKNLVKQQTYEIDKKFSLIDSKIDKDIENIHTSLTNQFEKQNTYLKDQLYQSKAQIHGSTIAVLAIFTALAFLIFGSIISIDNAVGNTDTDIKRLILSWGLWAFTCFNLILIFYCSIFTLLHKYIDPSLMNQKISTTPISTYQFYVVLVLINLIIGIFIYYGLSY